MNQVKYRFFIVNVSVIGDGATITFNHGHRSLKYANEHNIIGEVALKLKDQIKILGIIVNNIIEVSSDDLDWFFTVPKIITPDPKIIQLPKLVS